MYENYQSLRKEWDLGEKKVFMGLCWNLDEHDFRRKKWWIKYLEFDGES